MVDIFQLENGRIVEHWVVIQDAPAERLNPNGMFRRLR
jgi:predicted SnoaL-like aldol condensation-catalyzing enzyme